MVTLQEALNLNKPTKKVEFNGCEISLRLLTSKEVADSYEDVYYREDLSKFIGIQKQILARAITTVNGIEIKASITKEEEQEYNYEELKKIAERRVVQDKLDILDQVEPPIIAFLYNEYQYLTQEQEKKIESLKKKEKTHKADTSGKSLSKQDLEASSKQKNL